MVDSGEMAEFYFNVQKLIGLHIMFDCLMFDCLLAAKKATRSYLSFEPKICGLK